MISVNITTISTRIEICCATLWSLANQDLEADKIFLWISKEPYMIDKGIDEIPDCLVKIIKQYPKIEVKYTENIGPYRKIIPALRNATDEDYIFYADDDVIYTSSWLSKLMSSFLKNNGAYVVANRVRKVKRNFLGSKKTYLSFPLSSGNTILSNDYIIIGIGGCLLQKKHIKNHFISSDDFMMYAPRTDDLWISKILIESGTSVLVNPDGMIDINEIQIFNGALNDTNVSVNKGANFFNYLLKKVYVKFFSFIPLVSCNNDIAIKKIDIFFENKRTVND